MKRCIPVMILVLLFILLTPGSTYGRISLQEREALLALYNKTGGRNWLQQKNWNQAPGSENTWQGITCDAANTTVLKIELPNNRLQGVLPADLRVFSNMTILDLSNNRLTGEIPRWIESFKSLKKLNLSNNDFSGSIHAWIGSLKNLEELVLDNNSLDGTIPKELAHLVNLKVLRLAGNRMTGEIPAELVRLVNLEDNRSDFKWNGLYTRETGLKEFLRSKQLGGDWESTQTTAPSAIEAESTEDTVTIRWNPITYTAETGGYLVFYREEGKPYDDKFVEDVTGKRAVEVSLTGLKKSTKYHFKIYTWTDSHRNNKNRIESLFSDEISKPTRGIIISGTIINKKDGKGFPGVLLISSNGGGTAETDKDGIYRLSVMPGWTGTVTPFREGFKFFPSSTSYDREVTERISGNDYTAESGTVISGTVAYKGRGVSDVTLKFTSAKGDHYSAITDEKGKYKQAVSYDWSGTVTPKKDWHKFDPVIRKYENITSFMEDQDYEVQLPKIFGKVINRKGKGVSGVKLIFSNVETGKFNYLKDYAITDEKGNYENDVPENWKGILTQESSRENKYLFYPQFRRIKDLKDANRALNFKVRRNFKFSLQVIRNLIKYYGKYYDLVERTPLIYPEITMDFQFIPGLYIWSVVDFIFKRLDYCSSRSILLQQHFSFGLGFNDSIITKNPNFELILELGIVLLSYQESNFENKIQSKDWGMMLGCGFIYNYDDRWFTTLKLGMQNLSKFISLKIGVSLGYRF
jgi:Leucine-rich repeat (LRR) protein